VAGQNAFKPKLNAILLSAASDKRKLYYVKE